MDLWHTGREELNRAREQIVAIIRASASKAISFGPTIHRWGSAIARIVSHTHRSTRGLPERARDTVET